MPDQSCRFLTLAGTVSFGIIHLVSDSRVSLAEPSRYRHLPARLPMRASRWTSCFAAAGRVAGVILLTN